MRLREVDNYPGADIFVSSIHFRERKHNMQLIDYDVRMHVVLGCATKSKIVINH